VLNYQYAMPSGWDESRTEDAIVITGHSGDVQVTISEEIIGRWQYPSVSYLASNKTPDMPDGWDSWALQSGSLIKSSTAFEFHYQGVKDGTSYQAFVQWYLWGDLRIQVVLEVPTNVWNTNEDLQLDIHQFLVGFAPHDGTTVMTEAEVLAVLSARLTDRPSGVFIRDEAARARVELSCRDIFEDLMSQPSYVGNGAWQTVANTLQGPEGWIVYEPTGLILPADSNNSRC
jgi:hypothetical protein